MKNVCVEGGLPPSTHTISFAPLGFVDFLATPEGPATVTFDGLLTVSPRGPQPWKQPPNQMETQNDTL